MNKANEKDKLNATDYVLFAIVALCLIFWVFSKAHAEGTTANVSWVNATEAERTNAATGVKTTVPLPASDIVSTTVQWFVGTTKAGEKTLQGNGTQLQVPGLICGDYTFKAFHTHVLGTQGALSNAVAYPTGISCVVPKGPTVTVSGLFSPPWRFYWV